jgi:ubiquinone/menaquinone biosynthesis C-methylase UbiE
MYQTTPAWEIGRPQPALQAIADRWTGAVLDVGCGTGEAALLAAQLGLAATGIDMSPRAIAWAERKARERTLAARFVVGDACALEQLGATFDTVVDSALFHTLSDADRPRYVASVARVAKPGSRYYLLCFSERQPGDWGPRRVTQAELRASFADGWRFEAIEPAAIELSSMADRALAWLATLTRA